MDPGHRGWPPQPGGNPHGSNAEQNQSQASRPPFGAGQQSPPQGPGGLPPPPTGPFPHFHQQQPSLQSLAGISHSSPRQPHLSAGRPDGPPQAVSQGPQLPLPGFSQATGQPGAAERDRERAREAEIHIKEEEDRRHREQQERQRLEQVPPHQTQPGPPMHLHQPIAVGPRTVHGPNGLLGNPGPQPQPHLPLGAPSGPGNIFAGGPVQPPAQSQPPPGHQLQPGLLMPFVPGAQAQVAQQQQLAQQTQQGQGQGQGQQPILNDALSYLDQVKVQFADHPDVYNRFLDIMKDFKSGAIDTPGVIGRVSTLFAGNPELIQGFNTFLPPGYRIECGADNDPNAIRVTTPMGTTVSSMPQPRPLSRQEGGLDGARPANGTFTPQPGQSAQMMFSPSGRPIGPAAPGQQQQAHLSPLEAARQQEQQAMHQQEQRGVNSLQSAVSAAAGTGGLRAGVSPRTTPMPGQQDPNVVVDGQQGQQGMEKRGPVEFNHAISYVNKIKNRFSSHPDIYKQFLEILQTYQRESKPIQDVYNQVTHLFKTAPDLLEDFKQFLPESAAQAKAAERARQQAEETAMFSNVRGDGGGPFASPVMSREMGTPNHNRTNLPPVGNFAPTPISKDGKRKRSDRQGTVGSAADGGPGPSTAKPGGYGGQQGKRMKQSHPTAGKGTSDQPPPSPTLVPRLPEPLPPTTTSAATHDELVFFDRVKKTISNKNIMNEFLKLCNLFSHDFIDRTTLLYRATNFIGANPDLLKWFQDFVGYEEKDIVIENKARQPMVPGGRVSLSNCRGMGPSYRLLPKRERVKVCSGRDELCNSVLNDDWASHPTWASEDSGFIAHRKNMHEEGLHRIEEERHDYDYNIEACGRTIQLLEPIALQLRRLSTDEQLQYNLPPGLGGQSETIYKRVIMKMYGREKGAEVVQQLEDSPYQVIPVLLNRLKERLETWKMGQREWEKVWRDQTQKMFWKSLDHQAIIAKASDRRQFQTKTLQQDIAVKYEEQKQQEAKTAKSMRGVPQIAVQVTDQEVVVDATWLMLVHVDAQGSTDSPRLGPFIREFVPLFFGIDPDWFQQKLTERMGGTPVSGDALDEPLSGAEDPNGERRGRKPGKNTLLRQTLDKGPKGKFGRKDREDSNVSLSRASTPDVASNAGDETAADSMAVDVSAEDSGAETKVPAEEAGQTQRWFDHPISDSTASARKVDSNEPQKRDTYRLWANTPIYCFVRMFLFLYERLHKLKLSEDGCREVVRNAKKPKPAHDLGIMDKMPQDFFADTSSTANYYQQMLKKFSDVLEGEIDFTNDGVEDCLRRFYLQSGYPLYAFEKMVQALARYGSVCVSQEAATGAKEKSWEVLQLFRKDRVKEETSALQRSDFRLSVERLVGSADLYEIDWDQLSRMVNVYIVKKDDPQYTTDGAALLDQEGAWQYYLASYTSMEDTVGVDQKRINQPILMRNMRSLGADPKSERFPPLPRVGAAGDAPEGLHNLPTTGDNADSGEANVGNRLLARFLTAQNEEKLVVRIAVNNYHPLFQPGTAEGFFEDMKQRQDGETGVKDAEEARGTRAESMTDGFVMMNAGMRGLSKEEVEKRNEEFERRAGEGRVEKVLAEEEDGVEKMEVDE